MDTCKECNTKKRRFCHKHSVGRGSQICKLVLKDKFEAVKLRLGLPFDFGRGRKEE